VLTASVLGAREGYGQQAQLLSSVGAQIINSQYGQGAELEADKFGMNYMAKAGFDPQGAVGLQRTFVELSKGQQSNLITRMFASHPPSQKRVEENIKTAAGLTAGGTVGEASYKKAMASLFKSEKAYESFDEAQIAFKNNDIAKASALLNQAIRLEPREAHFHSMQGDIALSQNKLSSAKGKYDKAISLNEQFYYYYLQRGKIYEKQNNARAAQADYAASLRLLPTTGAQLGLGQFAERDGNVQVAKRYYAMAAQSTGSDAERAKAALMRLDPPAQNDTDTRLLVRQGLDRNGHFVIELINQTSRSVSNVHLGIQATRGAPQHVKVLTNVIPAGQRFVYETGQRMTRAGAQGIQVVILKADIVR